MTSTILYYLLLAGTNDTVRYLTGEKSEVLKTREIEDAAWSGIGRERYGLC
jgi:hypothetical protein